MSLFKIGETVVRIADFSGNLLLDSDAAAVEEATDVGRYFVAFPWVPAGSMTHKRATVPFVAATRYFSHTSQWRVSENLKQMEEMRNVEEGDRRHTPVFSGEGNRAAVSTREGGANDIAKPIEWPMMAREWNYGEIVLGEEPVSLQRFVRTGAGGVADDSPLLLSAFADNSERVKESDKEKAKALERIFDDEAFRSSLFSAQSNGMVFSTMRSLTRLTGKGAKQGTVQ